MSSSIVKSTEKQALRSAITGGVFYGVDSLYYKASDAQMPKRAIVAAGAQMGAELSEDYVTPMVLRQVTSAQSAKALGMLVNPILTGGFYVAFNKASPGMDNKSMTMQFLHAVGSSVAAQYVSEPLEKMIIG